MSGVLVDTSVWIDHFRHHNEALVGLLAHDQVMGHPLIVGELACGTPPERAQTLSDLALLRPAQQASVSETLQLIETERLFGLGCGLVDIMLLASTLMTAGARLWTLDQRLAGLAERLGVLHHPKVH